MKSSLIKIKIGDLVSYKNIELEVVDYVLTPNGINSPELIVIIFAKDNDGNVYSGTSDKFKPIDKYVYEEFYPSVYINHL